MEQIGQLKNQQSRGFMLITSCLVVLVLGIFGSAIFIRHRAFVDAVTRNSNRIVAFNVAEAGLDQAITALRAQNANAQAYAGTNGFVTMSAGNMQGRYQIIVCPPTCSYQHIDTTKDPADPLYSTTVTLPQPTAADVYLVQSIGQASTGNDIQTSHEERVVQTYITKQYDALFKYAVFSNGSIRLTGNATTDAYDSSLGLYSSQPMQVDGDIGTNSTSAGGVTLSGNNVRINGDVVIGPGGNPNIVISGDNGATSKVAGQKVVATTATSYPVISPDPSASYPPLPAGGGNLSGTYVTNTLTIDNNSTYAVTGKTVIYATGVDIKGKGTLNMNDNSVPGNLIIYVSGDEVEIDLTGQGKISAAIYAPAATVENKGQGEIFGAVISGEYVQTGNAVTHFDKGLMPLVKDLNHSTYKATSWSEQSVGVYGNTYNPGAATPSPGPSCSGSPSPGSTPSSSPSPDSSPSPSSTPSSTPSPY